MPDKKHILFVMNNLNVGGAEKALVSLLQIFDYENYNVDLLLFRQEGLFLKQLPPQVHVLEEPPNYRYFDMPFSQVLKQNYLKGWNVIFRRIMFYYARKKASNAAEAEQFGWRALAKTLKPLPKKYDVAIGFLEKNPNYFVVEKTDAKKKMGYIHNDYGALQMNSSFDSYYFRRLSKVITVSEQALDVLKKKFPALQEKFILIENTASFSIINNLKNQFTVEKKNGLNIVSVGRLSKQKGYHIGIEAAQILRKNKIPFYWRIIGAGELKNEIYSQIQTCGLEDCIELLGLRENPYPYIANADVFLQTSLFEGKSVAIDEAKILNVPIVVTNFNTASEQIKNKQTGLICDMDGESVAKALINIFEDKSLGTHITNTLKCENDKSEQQIGKLYHLINS